MAKPKAVIIRTAGTNCDMETMRAFELAGAQVDRIHINRFISGDKKLDGYQILAIPGGFSYGDDIASGKILANELKNKLGGMLQKFALAGKPIIGICNGFQVLVKMGLLPGKTLFKQSVTLTYNECDKFECRWVYLKSVLSSQCSVHSAKSTAKVKGKTKRVGCLWTRDLPEIIELPVAHGEGNFVAPDAATLAALEKRARGGN
jgi:phosphoribosylformylglycinamidine synthase